MNWHQKHTTTRTLGDCVADYLATFIGSWKFIIGQVGIMTIWVVINTLALFQIIHFDTFPFVFLNLFMSAEAAFATPLIMMSQNRQAARDRVAASLDYEVNLKAEVEIMALHEKLDRIRVEHLEGLLQDQTQRFEELDKLIRTSSLKPFPS